MIPDTHAHLDLIEREADAVVSEARSAGVSPVITIGINITSSARAVRLAEELDGVYATVGIHPNDTASAGPHDIDQLRRLAVSSERVVAVGESGLDYYRGRSPAEKQKELFRSQIRLARGLGKALVVHDRDAHDDVLEILAEEDAGDLTVVLHCFSGGGKILDECLRRRYFISLAGPLTFRNAEAAREVARLVPSDRLLVETDSPFLSPEPFRGKPNYPARVRCVADELARVRSVPPEEMYRVLSENAQAAFGIMAGNDE